MISLLPEDEAKINEFLGAHISDDLANKLKYNLAHGILNDPAFNCLSRGFDLLRKPDKFAFIVNMFYWARSTEGDTFWRKIRDHCRREETIPEKYGKKAPTMQTRILTL